MQVLNFWPDLSLTSTSFVSLTATGRNLVRNCLTPLCGPPHLPRPESGTEKVLQRTCVTKILPKIRVNFLVRFASKPLFYVAPIGAFFCTSVSLINGH